MRKIYDRDDPSDPNYFPPIDPDYVPTKTYSDLLAEGLPHKGGLAQLAAAEQMENPPPQIAAIRYSFLQIESRKKTKK